MYDKKNLTPFVLFYLGPGPGPRPVSRRRLARTKTGNSGRDQVRDKKQPCYILYTTLNFNSLKCLYVTLNDTKICFNVNFTAS